LIAVIGGEMMLETRDFVWRFGIAANVTAALMLRAKSAPASIIVPKTEPSSPKMWLR
jgi:hypothetical protein